MMKIDVAINSYKKPESLIYTLMTLKKVAGDMIDTVYINDDLSGNGVCDIYRSPAIREYFKPWKINVRENIQNVGLKQVYVRGYYPNYMDWKYLLKRWPRFWRKKFNHNREDIRYQYAIDHTDKEYLLIVHDDVRFIKNVIPVFFEAFQKDPELMITGELGQCWRCKFANFCHSEDILKGKYPSKYWPCTPNKLIEKPENYSPEQGIDYACRINEWCCMLNVKKALAATEESRAFFGNMYPHADTAAYWFAESVRLGYKFTDPLLKNKNLYYTHQWQGYTGNSVWEDQGDGIAIYNYQQIIDLMASEFNFIWPDNRRDNAKAS